MKNTLECGRHTVRTEVVMDTKGRKLFRYVAGIMTAAVLMGSAYATTAMASGIGLIDTADLLDVHAEASDSSDVVGQVMDEGHVAILGRADGWVQIKAGEIIGWVPEANLIETEVSNEEAFEANQKVVAEFAEDVMDALEEDCEPDSEEAQPEETEEEQDGGQADAEPQDAAEPETAESAAEDNAAENAAEADFKEDVPAGQEKEKKEPADAQKLAEKQAKEQAKAVEAAQKLAEEQAKAVEAAQKLAEEQAKAVEAAQKLAEEQAKAVALAQKQAEEQAKAAGQAQAALDASAVSAEDLELLASIIYCEANGEPYIGKVAVGNVVLNRVKSSRYPNTIRDVIYAKGQFSPVKNGSMAKALKNNSADASCYQAALEALAGSEPVGSKTSFRRVNGRSGQVIGHHVFY